MRLFQALFMSSTIFVLFYLLGQAGAYVLMMFGILGLMVLMIVDKLGRRMS